MFFNIIGSGSKGNATLIKSKHGLILIDMGLTLERLTQGLEEIGENIRNIDGVLFTHEHTDHIKGIKFVNFTRMYALEGTLPGIYNVVEPYETFEIKDFKIKAITTRHDANNPCGYVIEADNEKLVYITDTGFIPEKSLEYCSDPDYLIIESNHDISMLMRSDRPMQLKERILSDEGHLCNEDSAIYAMNIIGPRTKQIFLAHLSEECNTPELALEAYERVFEFYHVNALARLQIKCAKQWESTLGGHYED